MKEKRLADDVEIRIKKLVSKCLKINTNEIKEDAAFVNDLGAGSLDLIELILAMNDEFGIDIEDEEAEKLITVKDGLNYIREKLKEQNQ